MLKSLQLVLSFLAFSCGLTHACTAPIQGIKYDSLIEVKEAEFGEYGIVFPDEAGEQQFSHAELIISNKSGEDSQVETTLKTKVQGNNLIASFRSFGAQGLNVSVQVWWYEKGNLCPIIGNKTIKVHKI